MSNDNSQSPSMIFSMPWLRYNSEGQIQSTPTSSASQERQIKKSRVAYTLHLRSMQAGSRRMTYEIFAECGCALSTEESYLMLRYGRERFSWE
jgi:hypothetical protein